MGTGNDRRTMDADRKAAGIAGTLFLLAMITSLAGGAIIDAVTGASDFLTTASQQENRLMTGAFLELINSFSVVGIAAAMSLFIKRYSRRIAAGYMCLRTIESVVCAVAAIIPISYAALSRAYLISAAPDMASFQLAGLLLSDVRANITGLLTPLFFSLSALLFYHVLFRTKLVPRFISVWGFVAAILVIFLNVFPLAESMKMYFALPIILNEIFLGIWLVIKGVRSANKEMPGLRAQGV